MKKILSLTRRCVEDYDMIQAGDRVAVGVSGGKDSLTLLAALARLSRFYPQPFTVEAFTVDMGIEGMDFSGVAQFCEELGVPYHIIPTQINKVIFETRKEKNPCSMCAKMRRGALNQTLLERGLHKLALGHHYDDAIETVLMGLIYGGQVQAMLPRLKSRNWPGMELIRPMYCIHEDDIIAWSHYNGLEFIRCACRFTENCTICDNGGGSKRQEIKTLLRRLKRDNPNIEKSIFNSIHAVSLDTFPGYKTKGEAHSFLEGYDG